MARRRRPAQLTPGHAGRGASGQLTGPATTPMPAAPLPADLPRSYIVASKDRIHKPRRQAAPQLSRTTTQENTQ